MLEVRTTPNMFGITLAGDYQDLNALYDSISRYLSFYEMNAGEYFPYHESEYLLSLNYDIRHAYMGMRNVEVRENNEYFSVEILYPLVFHYLIVWEEILEDEPTEDWFGKETMDDPRMETYDVLDMQRDAAQIRLFLTLVWENLKELFGREKAAALYHYKERGEVIMPAAIYTDAAAHCQMVHFQGLTREEKKDYLLGLLYEMMDADEFMDEYEDFEMCYNDFLNAVTAFETKPYSSEKTVFPFREDFYVALERVHELGTPLYHEDFRAFLEDVYGEIENEEPEW